MLLHSDTLFWFRANQSLFLLLNAVCGEETQSFLVFGLTGARTHDLPHSRLEHTIYRTQGEHAYHYATDAVS